MAEASDASSSSETRSNSGNHIEFKKPVFTGRVGKLPKKIKTDPGERSEPNNEESFVPVPYRVPKWSGLCPDGSNYCLEVLKSGRILEKIDITKQPYYVFGRLANCDVIMAHPTISRHHAVLQYRSFAEKWEPPTGWYLQDLVSTHGTLLNGTSLKPSVYERVKVGDQIKFGASTRTYIMSGPDYDSDEEAYYNVKKIKQIAEEEQESMTKEAAEKKERVKLDEEHKREEQGIDWGMGEDAEEEPDLSENPYAATANEELYLEDPKKTLRGFFEREGYDLKYECEERGIGQFLCRVELPLDDTRGRTMVAEVLHKGKKKEAVVACALEACRQLDRAGVLRQAKHEPRARKTRDWSADDYYSSDEDTFLDRTGSIEKKRRKRMARHGVAEKETDKPLTYDDLLKKIEQIKDEISDSEKTLTKLRSSRNAEKTEADEADELDAYMDSLKTQNHTMSEKAEISKTKMQIQKLKTELAKTQRLAELARPAHLPPLLKKEDSKMAVKVGSNSVVYGKRIKLKDDIDRKPKIKVASKQEEKEFVEEMDSDEENQLEEKKTFEETKEKTVEDSNSPHKDSAKTKCSGQESSDSKEELESEKKKVYGPMRPPKNYVIPENYYDENSERDHPEIIEEN